MLKGKRVFISGGAGVIGHEIVKQLTEAGAVLFVADKKPRPKVFPKSIIYRQGDLNYLTKQELDAFAPEIFFHLAASFERSTESYEFWHENFRDNVLLSHHLVTLLKDAAYLKKIIFASSYLIYDKKLYTFDDPQATPTVLNESDPIFPRNLTGCAKLSHEIELEFIGQFKKNIQVILPRIYRGYGRNSRDVISRWVRALLAGEEITVYNKQNIFDYMFAEDSAAGLIKLADSKFSGVINLGSGRSRSIEEVIEVLKTHFPRLKYKEEEIDAVYEASQADTTKLKKVTNWLPENTIETGIAKIVEFEKERKIANEGSFKNVLITSVSKKIPMVEAVKNAAKKISPEIKVYGGDINPDAIGQYFVDKFYKMPKFTDDALDKIITYLKKNNIGSIIPSRDGELLYWAKHKQTLKKEGVKVMISPLGAVEKSIDKLKFYQYLNKIKISAIETSQEIKDIKAQRFVVKERFGAGSESMGLNLTLEEALKHAEKLEDPIFQPFIRGEEYSVDLYVGENSIAKGAVARRRSLVVNGESQITDSVINKKLEKLCLDAAEALGIYGHAIFQVLEREGKFYLIECNARFGGASTMGIACGLDSFYWFLLEASGENIKDYPFLRSQKGLKQVRFPKDFLICE